VRRRGEEAAERRSTCREALFCFEDTQLNIRVATAQFDECTSLIAFPLNGKGMGRSWDKIAHEMVVGLALWILHRVLGKYFFLPKYFFLEK
jgi:hypothetical protein